MRDSTNRPCARQGSFFVTTTHLPLYIPHDIQADIRLWAEAERRKKQHLLDNPYRNRR